MTSGGGWAGLSMGRRIGVVAGLLMWVAAIAFRIFGPGSHFRPQPSTVTLRDVLLDPGSAYRLEPAAESSPTIVADPTEDGFLAEVNGLEDSSLQCVLHRSRDDGLSWNRKFFPSFPDAQSAGCSAPDASFGGDGTLYVSYSTHPPGADPPAATALTDGLWVAVADSGRGELGKPVRVAGASSLHARIAADPDIAGRVYLTWLQAGEASSSRIDPPGSPVVVARSDDFGRTFSPPSPVSQPGRHWAVGPTLAVSDGAVHVVYLDVMGDRVNYLGAPGPDATPLKSTWSLVAARSTDGGIRWTQATIDPRIVPARRFTPLQPPTPSVGARGPKVVVALDDARLGDPDVWLWRSDDHGGSWSNPVRVNDTRPGDGRSQYLPVVSITSRDRVYVAYYDRRKDPADKRNEVSLQASHNGGKSFRPRARLTAEPFDSAVGSGGNDGMASGGNRLAMAHGELSVVVAWRGNHDELSGAELPLLSHSLAYRDAESPVLGWILLGLLIPLTVLMWRYILRNPAPGELPKWANKQRR